MPIEFKSMLTKSLRMAEVGAPEQRFQPAADRKGWSLVPMSTLAHSLGTGIRRAKKFFGGDGAPEDHAAEKEHFRGEVHDALCGYYGNRLGDELFKKAGLNEDHWPTTAQIQKIAKKEIKRLGKDNPILDYIRDDNADSLARLPQMQYLATDQANRFRAKLLDQVIGSPAFKAGTLTREEVRQQAERLMQSGEFAAMFAQAREGKLQQLVQTFTGEPGELNTKLCMNASFDPADAARALEKACAHYTANPDEFHAEAQILSLDNVLRLRALKELISTKVSQYLDRLRSPGPERADFQQRLGSRHTDEEFDAALNSADAQIMGDLERFAPKLTTADLSVVDHVIAKHLESSG